jgi:hypothetical protein
MPQHKVGCRCCGTKSSPLFRWWESCSDIEGWQGVEFVKPMSDVVCTNCWQGARRNTLMVRPRATLFFSGENHVLAASFRSFPTMSII